MENLKFLEKIVQEIGTNFDLDRVLNVICKELLERFKVDRVAIAQYGDDPEKWLFLYEYKADDNVPSLSTARFSREFISFLHNNLLINNQDMVINDVYNAEIPDMYKDEHMKLGTKSILNVPIRRGDEKWGILGLMQNRYHRIWTKEEISLLHTVVDYIYVAIRQAQLFSINKHQAERESILREAISTVRSTLNIDEIKSKFVNIIGKYFNADRVLFSEYDFEKNYFKPADEFSEYLINSSIQSFIGFEWTNKKVQQYISLLKQDREINFGCLDEYIRQNDLENTEFEDLFKNWRIKSSYNVLVSFDKEIIGFFCIDYVQTEHFINEQDSDFLKTFANQMAIAIYQAKLLNSLKQISDRELVLRNTTEILRSSLDAYKIKNSFVDIIGNYFNSDRCLFTSYDKERKIFLPFQIEKLKSGRFNSLIGLNAEKVFPEFISKITKGKSIIIKDLEKTLSRKKLENYKSVQTLKQSGVKSDYGIVVKYKDELMGLLIIHFVEKKRVLTHDEIDFLKILSNQAAIALYHSDLYKKELDTAERERILRDVSNKIRSSLDIESVKREIVTQIGLLFNPDKVAIADYDPVTENYYVTENAEYRASKDTVSFVGVDFKNIPGFITSVRDIHLNEKDIVFNNLDKYLESNNLNGTPIEKFYRDFGFIASAAINIYYRDQFLGNIVITFLHHRYFSNEEIRFLRSLADQVGVAIFQAKLYKSAQQTAENERVLRQIVLSSVSSFNIEDIIKSIVTDTGIYFKADRCFYVEYDPILDTHKSIKKYSEYRSSERIKIFAGRPFLKIELDFFEKQIKLKKVITVNNIDEIYMPKEPRDMIQKELSVKSYLIAPVFYGEIQYGAVVLHYVNNYKYFTRNDINVAEAVATQSAIVLHQAELYKKVEELSNKEKLLREIVSNIKLSKNLEQSYKYILSKLAEVFDVPRVFFVGSDELEPHKIQIRYEYTKSQEYKSFKTIDMPSICVEMLKELMNTQQTKIINDIMYYHPDNQELQKFYAVHNVRSFMVSPFLKRAKESICLGVFVLCSKEQKEWTVKDINLFEEILEASVSVIWEIIKREEIDELRNTFILTLAHDLQVPLVGERRALEFIMSIPPGQMLDKYKDIISETIKSNEKISNFLKKLVDSYTYELDRKQLHYVNTNIIDFTDNILNSLAFNIEEKQLIIEKEYVSDRVLVSFDQEELSKVINILMDNAIIYSPVGGTIIIKIQSSIDNVVVSVADNGMGISKEVQSRLFKRYEMALALERKIGSGLGLYLAKQIIEAHNGKIWYTTKEGKGSTFSFSIPIY